jgi:AcrR family transcriptional regulator
MGRGENISVREPRTASAVEAARRGRLAGPGSQRGRLVAAVAQTVAELGWSAVGVHHICQRAGVSRRSFYELYSDRDACVLDGMRRAFDEVIGEVDRAAAIAGADREGRTVAIITALIGVLDADRARASLCVVAPLSGNPGALRSRRAAMSHLGALLSEGAPSDATDELLVAGALGGVWELLHSRLTDDLNGPLADVAGPAAYFVLVPFVGHRRATERMARMRPPTAASLPEPAIDHLPVTELASQTLKYLHAHPGARNTDLSRALGVRHDSQTSRHLVRLMRDGLVEVQRQGRANAWWLTAAGEQTVARLRIPSSRPRSSPCPA